MRSRSFAFLAGTIITSIFSINSYASIDVYTQAPMGYGFAQSAVWNDPNDPGFNWAVDSDQESWEYFGVTSNVRFNRISWYGTNSDGNFAVDLFSPTCFSCGADKVGGSGTFTHLDPAAGSNTLLPNPGPFSQADVHKVLVSGNLYSYYIDLSSTLTLDPTKGYALSVVNNYSSLPFAWALSNTIGPHLQYAMAYAAYKYLPGQGDLAFTLTNTSVSAVPVPASVWFLGSGLLYLLGIARKGKTA